MPVDLEFTVPLLRESVSRQLATPERVDFIEQVTDDHDVLLRHRLPSIGPPSNRSNPRTALRSTFARWSARWSRYATGVGRDPIASFKRTGCFAHIPLASAECRPKRQRARQDSNPW